MCKFKSGYLKYRCPRPVWSGGESDEEYCLFHSKNLSKANQFSGEINLVKASRPSQLYQMGERKGYKNGDFLGFFFPARIDFSNHLFEEKAAFSHSKFKGGVDFSGVEFSKVAAFNTVVFDNEAKFFYTKFGEFARFYKAEFNENADFRGAKFTNEAIFFGAKFKHGCNFDWTHIRKGAVFSLAEFLTFSFYSTRIGGRLLFVKAIINGRETARFTYANLRDSNFTRINLSPISFYGADLRDVNFVSPSFTPYKLKHLAFWDSMVFGRPWDAIAEEVGGRKISFWSKGECSHREDQMKEETRSGFKYVITGSQGKNTETDEGQEYIISQLFSIEDVIKERRWKERDEEFKRAETVYTALKNNFETNGQYSLARRMRACEMEARLNGSANPFEKAYFAFYRFLNGYGLRWLRALVFWFLIIVFFATQAYDGREAVGERYIQQDSEAVQETFIEPLPMEQAFMHAFQVGGVFIEPTRIIKECEVPVFWGWFKLNIRWLEMIQRVLSPFFLFLFFQAVRNRTRG